MATRIWLVHFAGPVMEAYDPRAGESGVVRYQREVRAPSAAKARAIGQRMAREAGEGAIVTDVEPTYPQRRLSRGTTRRRRPGRATRVSRFGSSHPSRATVFSKTYTAAHKRLAPGTHITDDGLRSRCGREVAAVQPGAPTEHNVDCHRCLFAGRRLRVSRFGSTRAAYAQLTVYPYRRPGQRTDSWAVATGDQPQDVVHRTNSKAAAVTWAKLRSARVRVEG